jgi:hypothetical protein
LREGGLANNNIDDPAVVFLDLLDEERLTLFVGVGGA